MNFKSLNVGCSQNEAFRTSSSAQHFCWNEAEGRILLYDGQKYLYKYSVREMKEEGKLDFTSLSRGKRICSACYSKRYESYFVLAEDFNMYLIKYSDFSFGGKFQTEMKNAFFLYFLDAESAFIVLSSEQLNYMEVQIKTNLFTVTNPANSYKTSIKVITNYYAQDDAAWNNGFYFGLKDGLMTTWDNNQVRLYYINKKLQGGIALKQIGSRDNMVSCSLFIPVYEYAIIGYNNGVIRVYKVGKEGRKQLVFSFEEAHNRSSVMSLCRHDQESKLIVSAGQDCCIRIWDIDTFSFLFSFKVATPFQQFSLLSSIYFTCQHDNQYFVGYITSSLKFLAALDAGVSNFSKCSFFQDSPRVHFVLKNNQGLSLNCSKIDQYSYSKTKQLFSVVYPPPLSKKILSIQTCPFRENIFFVHIETGGFCIYEQKKVCLEEQTQEQQLKSNQLQKKDNPEKKQKWEEQEYQQQNDTQYSFQILQMISPQQFIDESNQSLQQNISVIRFIDILTPCYDVDQCNPHFTQFGSEKEWDDMSEEEYNKELKENQLVALGCEKGSIIFISMKNGFDKIHTRLSLHRDEINELAVLKQNNKRLLLSLSRDGFLKITKLAKNQVETLRVIEVGRNVDLLMSKDQMLAITLMTGEMMLFKYKNINQIICKKHIGESDHEMRITSIDMNPKEKLVITSSQDNKVRIWNYNKIVLLQIVIPERLTAALFPTDGMNIIIAHSGWLSLLTYNQIKKNLNEGISNAKAFLLEAEIWKQEIDEIFGSQNAINSIKSENFSKAVTYHQTETLQISSKPSHSVADIAKTSNNTNNNVITSATESLQLSHRGYNNKIRYNLKRLNNFNSNIKEFESQGYDVTQEQEDITGNKQEQQVRQQSLNMHSIASSYKQQSLNSSINFQDALPRLSLSPTKPVQLPSLGNSIIPFNKDKAKNLNSQHKYSLSLHQSTKNNSAEQTLQQQDINSNQTSPNYLSIQSGQTPRRISISNHDINMVNSPHYYFSQKKQESSLIQDQKPQSSQQKKALNSQRQQQFNTPLKPSQKQIKLQQLQQYKPLRLEQKYVCISALPKELKQEIKLDKIQSYQQDQYKLQQYNKYKREQLYYQSYQQQSEIDFSFSSLSANKHNPLFEQLNSSYKQKKSNSHNTNNNISLNSSLLLNFL